MEERRHCRWHRPRQGQQDERQWQLLSEIADRRQWHTVLHRRRWSQRGRSLEKRWHRGWHRPRQGYPLGKQFFQSRSAKEREWDAVLQGRGWVSWLRVVEE